MNIVDLRQATVRQLEPLLRKKRGIGAMSLHWDYRSALELIKRFLDAHALAGCVAFENGSAVGYSFYVLEEQKGLIGGLVCLSAKFSQATIGQRLLDEMLFCDARDSPACTHRSPTHAVRRAGGSPAERPGIPALFAAVHAAGPYETARGETPGCQRRDCGWTAGTIAISSRARS